MKGNRKQGDGPFYKWEGTQRLREWEGEAGKERRKEGSCAVHLCRVPVRSAVTVCCEPVQRKLQKF